MSAYTPQPCPFCGLPGLHRKADHSGSRPYYVDCGGCKAYAECADTPESAVMNWNYLVRRMTTKKCVVSSITRPQESPL